MFCKLCGKVSSSNKCIYCGHAIDCESNTDIAHQSVNVAEDDDSVNHVIRTHIMTPPVNFQDTPQFGMKWHKFVIYFGLFFGALIDLILGISVISGMIYSRYGIEPELVYDVFSGLKTLDVAVGLCCIALAVFFLVTRFQLSGMKKRGPVCLYCIYALNFILSLIYVILASDIIGEPIYDGEIIAMLAAYLVMLVLNVVYYKKRESLFIN